MIKHYETPLVNELSFMSSTILMASGPGGGGDSPGGVGSVPIKRPGSDFPTHH
ncbi:MAG: hypothetical protein IJS13_07805 [Paludibacteraceae bacterium]|nr:hypothetical protein [Paludibacteraceae bacterium]